MDNVIFMAFLRFVAQKLGMPIVEFASWLFKSLLGFLLETDSLNIHELMDSLGMDYYVICHGKEGKTYVGDHLNPYSPKPGKPLTISWHPKMTILRESLLMAIPFELDTLVIPSFITRIDAFNSYLYTSPVKVNHLIVSQGTKEIAPYSFHYSSIETVTLPDGLEKIGRDAFYHCIKLKDINIPDTLTAIEKDAFGGCEALPENIKEQLIAIGGPEVFGETKTKEQ